MSACAIQWCYLPLMRLERLGEQRSSPPMGWRVALLRRQLENCTNLKWPSICRLLYLASERAATPGRTLPSNNSMEAPPPVLQWVTLSIVLYFLHAVAVSPPPMTETAPFSVAPTTASMSVFVPASNLPISKTPIGPFQMIVFDASTAALFNAFDFGPQSKPMKPSGMPCSLVTSLTSPSSPNFEETVKSTGRMISTPFSLAFAMM